VAFVYVRLRRSVGLKLVGRTYELTSEPISNLPAPQEPNGAEFVVCPTGGQVGISRLKRRPMCEQCVEIDKKIENYQRMASRITDQPTLDGIKELIARMLARKAVLHPEQAK